MIIFLKRHSTFGQTKPTPVNPMKTMVPLNRGYEPGEPGAPVISLQEIQLGHPIDLEPILKIARDHGLFVIEDAAEAVGTKYKGRTVGGHGACATFSFFG
jgi:hypothetical protein